MAIRDILKLGNPNLYTMCEHVHLHDMNEINAIVTNLKDTLLDFQNRFNRGRAIAAPQVGAFKRIIFMHIDKPVVFLNPIIDLKSKELMEIWDDCLSFPDLLVKVQRHWECRIRYFDMDFKEQEMDLVGDLSELLQHEYDHLDGILAVSRAIDNKSFALRSEIDHIPEQSN